MSADVVSSVCTYNFLSMCDSSFPVTFIFLHAPLHLKFFFMCRRMDNHCVILTDYSGLSTAMATGMREH
ncbi:hypothetical protein VNO78_11558 [Psophocarpus tetragonolobus]|uniref:Uncharacterized protein n=1 Tax=Psophocarpus tetragonolobus TaxID=3891 RepID=A0AAN9SNE7_PSOTE